MTPGVCCINYGRMTPYPDRWEVGPYFAHHLASCTPLHPYVTLHFEKWAKEVHTCRCADEVERKGTSSAALQVPFLTTWVSGAKMAPLFLSV